MKLIKICTFFIAGFTFVSCEKADSEKEYGISRIYMPQAVYKSGGVDNNYPVPSGTDSSTYNYSVNTKDKKIDVVLGASLSGPGRDAYSVDIQVNNDTVQQLLTNKILDPAVYMLMPSSMYTLPNQLNIPTDQKTGTFTLSIDIAQLKSSIYIGKYLLLAVKLANPTAYELNSTLSTTMVVVDVNALVIGPSVNITNQYILNPGNPFVYSTRQPNQTRWGNLKDWNANAAAKSHGGYGGYSSDAGGVMNMESGWGSPQILNGKIYQTISLPAGSYSFDIAGGSWQELFTKDPAFVVVSPGVDTLPNYSNVTSTAEAKYELFAKPQKQVYFDLAAPTNVTIGVVVNYVQDQQGFKTKQVSLYKYPKHL